MEQKFNEVGMELETARDQVEKLELIRVDQEK
jgi:hypothetical protein